MKFGQVLGTVLTRLFSVSKSENPEIAKDRFQPVVIQKCDQPNQLQNPFTRIEHEKLVDRTSPKNTVSFKFSTRFKEAQNIFVIVVMTFLTGLTRKPSTQRSQRDGLCTVRARLLLKTLTLTRMNPCSDLEC